MNIVHALFETFEGENYFSETFRATSMTYHDDITEKCATKFTLRIFQREGLFEAVPRPEFAVKAYFLEI